MRCNSKIIELDFSDQQKSEIMRIIEAGKPLEAVRKMMDSYSIDPTKAKGIALHLNKYGKCIRCNFDKLEAEKIECPKCKSFNYNLKTDR